MSNSSAPFHTSLPSSIPNSSRKWLQIIGNLKQYSFFIKQLVKVSIITDFKRSIIGLLWLFILPIVSVLIWIILNGAGIIEPGDTGIPYPAYVLLSTSIWGFFHEMYKASSNVISSNGRILTMALFPHEVLIAEKIIVHLIQFTIPFAVNIIVLYLFGVRLTWVSLLFPLSLIPLLLLALSFGLIVALMRIVAVDLSKLADEGMKFLMFLTPIVYAPKVKIGWLSEIIQVNPLTYLIGFSRELLTQGTFFKPQIYLYCCLATMVLFILCLRLFLKAESRVLEKLINN